MKEVLSKLGPNLADLGTCVGLDIAETIKKDGNEGISRLHIRVALAGSFFERVKDKLTEDLNNTVAEDIRLR